MSETNGAALNTDKTLWESESGKVPSASVFITKEGALGICFNHYCIVRPIEKWHVAERSLSVSQESEARLRKALEEIVTSFEGRHRHPAEHMLEVFNMAQQALSASPSIGSGWMDIASAPKDGTDIILCQATDADGKPIRKDSFGIFVQVAAWWSGEGTEGQWVVYCDLPSEPRVHFNPTHFMPLPSPPLSNLAGEG